MRSLELVPQLEAYPARKRAASSDLKRGAVLVPTMIIQQSIMYSFDESTTQSQFSESYVKEYLEPSCIRDGKYRQICTSRTSSECRQLRDGPRSVLPSPSHALAGASEHERAKVCINEQRAETGRRKGNGERVQLFLVCDAERTEVVMCETWGHRLICA